MSSNHTKTKLRNGGKLLSKAVNRLLPRRRWLRRLVIGLIIFVVVAVGAMYGIAEWYIHSQRSQPLEQGVSFIPDYAQSLGLDPQQTMDALTSIGVKHFRLVSYWSDMEPTPGQYDFSQLDWEFKKAEAAHAKVILVVGLRQPRWPECHAPGWANLNQPESQWQPQLEQFMQKVIERYRGSPALQQYQLENEYFLKGFGYCTNFSRQRLVSEYNLVKQLDPHHQIIVGRSNNTIGLPLGQPQPDEFSVSVYKRVWDANLTHRYLEYPWPAWYYGFMAGLQKIVTGKNMMIGELQAEAWPPDGKSIQQTSLAEQNKSLDAKRLKARFQYGRATGMRQIYLWGAEYWYYRDVKLHDPSLWNVAKQEFQNQPQ
ncbi:MAG TPA: beta-galactosidase [Candidatus Saccharimonadales bacterium]|nr:beta-galactosidase [Candidatus Saccharimonadales bacterium]